MNARGLVRASVILAVTLGLALTGIPRALADDALSILNQTPAQTVPPAATPAPAPVRNPVPGESTAFDEVLKRALEGEVYDPHTGPSTVIWYADDSGNVHPGNDVPVKIKRLFVGRRLTGGGFMWFVRTLGTPATLSHNGRTPITSEMTDRVLFGETASPFDIDAGLTSFQADITGLDSRQASATVNAQVNQYNAANSGFTAFMAKHFDDVVNILAAFGGAATRDDQTTDGAPVDVLPPGFASGADRLDAVSPADSRTDAGSTDGSLTQDTTDNPWDAFGSRVRTNFYAGEKGQGSNADKTIPLSQAQRGVRYLYVVTMDGEVRLLEGRGGAKHSSLVPAGQAVRAAGELFLDAQGKVNVNTSSGHYMAEDPLLGEEDDTFKQAMEESIRRAGLAPGEIHPDNSPLPIPNRVP